MENGDKEGKWRVKKRWVIRPRLMMMNDDLK